MRFPHRSQKLGLLGLLVSVMTVKSIFSSNLDDNQCFGLGFHTVLIEMKNPFSSAIKAIKEMKNSFSSAIKAIKTLSKSPQVGIGVAAVVIPLVALGGGGGGDSGKNLTQARFS